MYLFGRCNYESCAQSEKPDFTIALPLIIFLSSPLTGKRDIVVTILIRCMCVRPCIRASVRGPSGFVRTITCTIMHGFQNNLAQLL